jgi:hypothetical protein
MNEVPTPGAVAIYRGAKLPILFGGDDWVALEIDRDTVVPDATERGTAPMANSGYEPWAKVPVSALDGVIDVVVTARLEGHHVSLLGRRPDGRVEVEFVGPPSVARELGLGGDQYMGWTGLFDPEQLEDIQVEEMRRE